MRKANIKSNVCRLVVVGAYGLVLSDANSKAIQYNIQHSLL